MKSKILLVVMILTTSVKSQELNDYLKLAEENNPKLSAAKHLHRSALEKVVEVGSLSNTTLGASYFVQEPETRVGAQKMKFTVVQKLPWFGALEARRESAALMANSKLDEVDVTRRELFLKVKTSYFKLYELKRKRTIVEENIEIMKTFESLALNELENNRASMVDVLKIRMEKNSLVNQYNSLEQDMRSESIAFNLLLNRKEDMKVDVPDNFNDFLINEDFSKELIHSNPKIERLQHLKKALNKSVLAVKKEALPTVGIGLDYVLVDERNVESLIDNGKDIIMPMVSVSLPLFSKKYDAKQKQLQLEQKAVDYNLENTKNGLITEYEQAVNTMNNAKASILTQELNSKEADAAKKVLLAGYEAGNIDFEQLLEIQQLQLKFQFEKTSSEKNYATQAARLEYLTKNN